jgi:hypothetical protein
MAVTIQRGVAAPVGAITQYSAVIGSLSKISGVQHTTAGQFLSKAANSAAGGVPVAGFQRFVLFTPSAIFLPTFAEVQYNPVAGPVAPVGTITEYSAATGSLTKICSVQDTTPGRFPYRAKTTLAAVVLGGFRHPLQATWLILTPGSTPAVQLPAGMIVSVSC